LPYESSYKFVVINVRFGHFHNYIALEEDRRASRTPALHTHASPATSP